MSDQDPILDDSEILESEEILDADEILSTQSMPDKKKKKFAEKTPDKHSDGLLIYDISTPGGHQLAAPIYRKIVMKFTEKEVAVGSWEGLARELQKYKTIKTLVLMAHGAEGAMRFGTTEKLDYAVEILQRIFGEKKPVITSIILEGCSISEDPGSIMPFADLFQASSITAYTHYLFSLENLVKIEIPKGSTIERVKEQIEYNGYYLVEEKNKGTIDAHELAKRGGEQTFLVEWFRQYPIKKPLPKVSESNMALLFDTFRPRSAAVEQTMQSDQVNNLISVKGFQRLTIRFSR